MLEHAKDLQTRLDLANAQLAILPSPENDLEDTYEVVRHTCKEFIALIERIEALMGKVDANQEGWSECMDYLNIANAKITELEAKIARLEAPIAFVVKSSAGPDLSICRVIAREWLGTIHDTTAESIASEINVAFAARAAEPANGAKENNVSLVTIVNTQPAAQKEGK